VKNLSAKKDLLKISHLYSEAVNRRTDNTISQANRKRIKEQTNYLQTITQKNKDCAAKQNH
jgi:hypothetical protein